MYYTFTFIWEHLYAIYTLKRLNKEYFFVFISKYICLYQYIAIYWQYVYCCILKNISSSFQYMEMYYVIYRILFCSIFPFKPFLFSLPTTADGLSCFRIFIRHLLCTQAAVATTMYPKQCRCFVFRSKSEHKSHYYFLTSKSLSLRSGLVLLLMVMHHQIHKKQKRGVG